MNPDNPAADPRLQSAVTAHPYPLLFATISGAHLYGFPSADSDFDLRGVHLLSFDKLLGLEVTDETLTQEGIIGGLEVDLVTHDARKFFGLLLKKNGYVLEQVFSPLVVHAMQPHFDTLREIAKRCITRHHVHHYQGFAQNQWELFEKEHPHRVLLHEFGHVLGLDHPDKIGQRVVAVMNSVISDTDGLTADDIGGTTSIYGDPALRSVPVTAYGVAVDNGRGKIYVSTQKTNGKGSLKVVDPYAAQIVGSVRTGSKPDALALSGGGEHLYLGVDGLGVIDQIDPDTLATTQEFPLGAQPGVTAADMAVLPGAPESVVVSQAGNTQGAIQHSASPSSGDFAVYDQGVLRPAEEFDSHVAAGSPLILDDSGQTFYGFYGAFYGSTSGQISRFTIDAAGVSPLVQEDFLATGNLTGGAEYSQGSLYGSDGSVADLTHGADAAPFTDVQAAGRAYTVEADGVVGRTYFALPRDGTASNAYWPTLLVEDNATRAKLGNIALPRYAPLYLVRRWGANGLLICLSDKRMLLVRSSLIGPGPVTGVPVTVTLGAPMHASIDEGSSTKAKLVVTRTDGDLSAPLDVHYTVAGTAQNGVDFRALSGVVTIPTGQATAKIKVIPVGSQFSDGSRTVQIRLASDANYRWGTSSTATVNLTNE